MTKKELAIHYFTHHFNCSQSVFTAFAPDFGISADESLKIACAFGGGMGRRQLTCCAVTGALMALGLKYAKDYMTMKVRNRKPMKNAWHL
jgi:C_GCAxxG_C_C family probable redox protein